MKDEGSIKVKALPSRVVKRLQGWKGTYQRSFVENYLIGTVGVATSTLAASQLLGNSQLLSTISAVCIALLGFYRPDRRHVQFWQAWRTLDAVAMRYEFGLASLEELIDAVRRGEDIIGEIDNQPPNQAHLTAPGT